MSLNLQHTVATGERKIFLLGDGQQCSGVDVSKEIVGPHTCDKGIGDSELGQGTD